MGKALWVGIAIGVLTRAAAAEPDDSRPGPAPADVQRWRDEEPPGPEDDRFWASSKVLVTTGKKRVAVKDRDTLSVLPALERALLLCTGNARDGKLAGWPDRPNTLPSTRLEAYLRSTPLSVSTATGEVDVWGALVDLGALDAGEIGVLDGDERILLTGCATCELAGSAMARLIPAAQRRACNRRVIRRRGPPPAEPEHSQPIWVVYLTSAVKSSDPEIARGRQRAAALGYNAEIANLGCDTGEFSRADHEYMSAVYFATRQQARQFAKLLAPDKPAFVGKVKTYCLD